MMSAAQRSITSLRYDRALSRAVLARSRAHGADPARQLFQVGDVVYYWRGNGKAKREWAAHWHGPATVIGLQHESLWLAHRTTTVKCSKDHVRLATASEQLPFGPIVHHRCHLVVTCKLQKICSWISMNSHRNAHGTPSSSIQQFDFANPDECAHRARNVSVPLPRTPEQLVPARETPFQPVSHGNAAPETPQLSVPSTPPFQCFPGGETAAPVTPRVDNSKNCSTCAIILSSCLTSDAQHVRSSIHVARGFCCCAFSRTITFQRNLMRNQQSTRSSMIHSSLTILLYPHM